MNNEPKKIDHEFWETILSHAPDDAIVKAAQSRQLDFHCQKVKRVVEAANRATDNANVIPESCLPEGRYPSVAHVWGDDFNALVEALEEFHQAI